MMIIQTTTQMRNQVSKVKSGYDLNSFMSKWYNEHPDQAAYEPEGQKDVPIDTSKSGVSSYMAPAMNTYSQKENSGIQGIVDATRNKNFSSPNIQPSNLQIDKSGKIVDAPRSREIDPISKQVLKTISSPLRSAVQGVQGAGDLAKESSNAIGKGDYAGGGLGMCSSLLRGGFSVATPAVPALSAFTAGSDVASQVIPENIMKYVNQPITSLVEKINPNLLKSLAGKSGSEIGDVIANLAMIKGGEKAFNFGKGKINSYLNPDTQSSATQANIPDIQPENKGNVQPIEPNQQTLPNPEVLPEPKLQPHEVAMNKTKQAIQELLDKENQDVHKQSADSTSSPERGNEEIKQNS